MLSYFKIKRQYLAHLVGGSKRRQGALIAIFIISLLAVFFVPDITHASAAEMAVEYVGIAVAYLLVAVLKLLGFILGLAGWLMDQAITFRNLRTDGVVKGWEVLRDLVNMFFILILLVVAFATVLNIEKYSIKAILPRLVIVALLINFSLPLVYVVVDASQIAMFGFYNAMTNGLDGSCKWASPGVCFSNLAGISDLLIGTSDPSATEGATDAWKRVTNLLMAIIFMLVFIVVVVAGALLLVVRIVGIWIAAVLSPLAIFSKILPGTSFFYNEWSKKFLQYTFFGPLYVFFLWISLILLQHLPNFMDTQGITKVDNVFGNESTSKFISQGSNVLQFIMVVVLLLWSFTITRKLGIKYGEKIAGNSEKFLKNVAWTADRAVARGEIPFTGVKAPGLKRVMPYFSYGAQKRAWAARKQEAERSSYSKATGAIEERIAEFSSPMEALRTIGRSIPGFRKPGRYHYETLRHQGEVSKKQNEISSAVKDEDQLVAMASTATDQVEKEALYRQMAATNAFNTFFANQGIEQNFANIQEHLRKTFGEKGGARIGAELAAIGIGSGNYTWAGMTKWDPKKGMIFGDIGHHENIVKTKMRELEPQRFMAGLHPDSIFDRKKDGTFGAISDTGEVILRNLTGMHLDQFNRMQGRDLVEMTRKISDVRKKNANAAAALVDTMFPEKKFPDGIPTLTGTVDRDKAKEGLHDAAIMAYVNATYR